MHNTRLSLLLGALLLPVSLMATHLVGVSVIDKYYLMVHFTDGQITYNDTGTGESAFKGHSFAEGDDSLITFAPRLDTRVAQLPLTWYITSDDDKKFGIQHPVVVSRMSKPLNTSIAFKSELDHWFFLRLPRAMKQGKHYTVCLPHDVRADKDRVTILFDVYSCQSEAIHVNLLGYSPSETLLHADLYQWLGDGGQREYHSFLGTSVYLYNVETNKKQKVGKVNPWKTVKKDVQYEAGGKNLVGTDVWNIDMRGQFQPGTYRLVVDGIGCSAPFEISNEVYREPYRYSVRGYYYMRLGEPIDTPRITPVPRQPRFIPGVDPKDFVIYKTDLTPYSQEWIDLHTDVWDEPHFRPDSTSLFWRHRLPGNPTADNVVGGHSDAFDWDRHIAHVGNIYDMLLPYLLTNGRLNEDDLGIRESGNGLPDLLDEARNEVDFFLSIRDGEGYSQGVTNPSNQWNCMFQAGCTTMAAWANAANCAMMADAMRVCGRTDLMNYYRDEAIKAFRYASRQKDQQLDERQDIGSVGMRGRDFRQQAAAFLYNVTGDTQWEKIMAEESMIKSDKSVLFNKGKQGYHPANVTNDFEEGEVGFCQIYAAAAYLICPQERHYPELYQHLLASIENQAQDYNVQYLAKRPSRRIANDTRWTTSQNVPLVILAHYICKDYFRKLDLQEALYSEASWSLGRNPSNIVQMTGLGSRHYTAIFANGRNDGYPEVHPGQTPFNGIETWTKGDGGDATILTSRCYPDWDTQWPQEAAYFNQRYFWVNGEFTPRETMRGKLALMAYLYGIRK